MARPSSDDMIKLYEQAKQIRQPREADFRMAAAYALPRQYSSWQNNSGPPNYSQESVKRIAYDSTGVRALPKFAAICERMATPHNMKWHGLTTSDRRLAEMRRVKLFFDELKDELFRLRYEAGSKFRQTSSEVYSSIGVYGMGPAFYGVRKAGPLFKAPGALYKGCAMRDIFVLVDDDGNVTTVFRRLYLNIRQFKAKFPGVPLPPKLAMKVTGIQQPKETDYFEFFHVVHPRSDYDPSSINANRHPMCGSYVSVEDKEYVGEEEGYQSMPYLTPRDMTESGDPYASSPTLRALPSLGTASAMKKTVIKQGQKAVDPVLLAHDDGMINGVVDLRPGHVNYGAVDSQGRKLIQALETGNFTVSEKLLENEREDINDSYFVTLFRILEETREMTATEIMERVSKESALMSPTMGRLQSEFLAPGIQREIDILNEIGRMPKMPPELIEARGQYEVVYTSPMAQGQYAEEVSGFMRAVEFALNIAQNTQDNSHLDHFNFDTAIPEVSGYMGVPSRWLNDPKAKEAIAESRSQQQQAAELMKNAAPLAGALKTAATMEQPQQA